jgi:transposase-like protein
MDERKSTDRGSSEATPACAGDDPARKPQRFSARLKGQIVMRLLRGEELELLSREDGTTAALISRWRDDFLSAGEAAMRRREDPENEEIRRLREKLGEAAMESELLREKIRRLEQNRPLSRRRPRK